MHSNEFQYFAVHMAKSAGAIMERNFSLGMKKLWRGDTKPDIETTNILNKHLIEQIKATFPDHGYYIEGEENSCQQCEYIWVCDPIDGTIPFSHGIPTCMFSLALTHHGESILGVVYDPFLDRMFFAEKGEGAYLNGQKICVSKESTLKKQVLCIESWRGWIYDLSGVVKALDKHDCILLNPCSITYMASLVATGECLATIYPGTSPHDTAAVKVIIEEAGGRVTDLNGNEQRYDSPIIGHITSNGIIHDELIEIIRANTKQSP